MTKEFVLPYGVKIIDGVLYFGDRPVSFYDEPYKLAHVPTMCTMFAIRYTNSQTSYPTLCGTLDLVLSEKDNKLHKPLIWLSTIRMAGERYLPSAYYDNWESVEYVLNTFNKELQGSEWFIEVDDIDDSYAWDKERGVFRRRRKIETVDYVWDDGQ